MIAELLSKINRDKNANQSKAQNKVIFKLLYDKLKNNSYNKITRKANKESEIIN